MNPTDLKISKKNINRDLDQVHDYFKLAISVDLVIFGYDNEGLKVLLLECDMPPYKGQYSLVGDLVRPAEDLDQAAYRILQERAQMDHIILEQVRTFGKADRHPAGRVITVAYFSLVKIEDEDLPNRLERGLSWHTAEGLSGLAFDHDEILGHCLRQMRKRVRELPLAFELLPKYFTLSQLQQLYEILLGVQLDKRNFRKKLDNMNVLVETSKYQENVPHRPAKLFKFRKQA